MEDEYYYGDEEEDGNINDKEGAGEISSEGVFRRLEKDNASMATSFMQTEKVLNIFLGY